MSEGPVEQPKSTSVTTVPPAPSAPVAGLVAPEKAGAASLGKSMDDEKPLGLGGCRVF